MKTVQSRLRGVSAIISLTFAIFASLLGGCSEQLHRY
jgi:hypothetical protein